MHNQRNDRFRLYVTALAVLAALVHLSWEYFHGGVNSHHLLNRADLFAVSNWWEVILLPALGWFFSGSALQRLDDRPHSRAKVAAAFLGSVLLGASLSAAFSNGYEATSSFIFLAIFASGLVLPIYRAEYVFGFVLGMTFVFGAVLPTMVASIAAIISAAFHFLAWPSFARMAAKVRA